MSAHRPQRIGKGGASALAPANTLESLDAALDVGVDMVEFDVRRWRGELILAHTVVDACRGGSVRLGDALVHLSSHRFSEIELNVDVKHAGFERELLGALRHAQVLERTLLSSQVAAVLDRLRQLEPHARVGISVGGRLSRLSQRWISDWRPEVLAGLAASRWDALMAHHRLIDASLLEEVVENGGRLYAWTVNERDAIQSLSGLGVHGITTADPRLFGRHN
ncbi:MAG: glycerophosphodiester phosphodiesterase [Solirubrobacteraceae bacterium]